MTRARDLANAGPAFASVNATELGYLDGVTSAIQTQLNSKEPLLPSQSGNSGKYLTTDGTNESWGTISAGGMTLLASGGVSANLSFTSISQDYKNLEIYFTGLARSVGSNNIAMTLNNITNTSYTTIANNSATTWTVGSSTLASINGYTVGGPYGVIHLTIPFYANSSNGKHWHSYGPAGGGSGVGIYYGMNSQCGAINRIDFSLSNVTAGSYFIYGVN